MKSFWHRKTLVPIVLVTVGAGAFGFVAREFGSAGAFVFIICGGGAIGVAHNWRNGWRGATKGLSIGAGAAVFVVVLFLMQSTLVSPDASQVGPPQPSLAQQTPSK